MSGQILAISAVSAVAALFLVRGTVRTPKRLSLRLAPYTERSRGRLGTSVPAAQQRESSVWGPIVTSASSWLARAADAGSSVDLELRLRRAGLGHLTAGQYRRKQLAYTVTGLAVGVAMAVVLRLSTVAAFVLAGAFALAGALRWRSRLDHLTNERRLRMRAEAHTVCQMLAVWLRTGDTPAGALACLAQRANGIVPGELAEAAAQIRSGATPTDVLERSAQQTAEPSAARLYRLLGATWAASGDPTALLALADDLRASRRDALARTMAKRRVAMALPLVAVIAPILILFVAAALPSIIFGR
ncbi:MAG: type II secretion system F family protein [Ilumatobacteraceae bacterium]